MSLQIGVKATGIGKGSTMQELAGKNALVTGGSRGIGAAIAIALSEKGANVAITYERSADSAERLFRTIERNGGKAMKIFHSSILHSLTQSSG